MPEDTKIKPISSEIALEPQASEHTQEQEEESTIEHKQETPVQKKEATEVSVTGNPPARIVLQKEETAPEAPSTKSEALYAIEQILEEDLEEAYWQLPPNMREQFKKRGEETARSIEQLLRAVHLNIIKVLRLLQKWLSMIPHVNAFFLEQEAKVKADKIIALHREQRTHT